MKPSRERRKINTGCLGFQAFRQHCIKKRLHSVMEISAWAQAHFQKSLSLNTVHHVINKIGNGGIHRCTQGNISFHPGDVFLNWILISLKWSVPLKCLEMKVMVEFFQGGPFIAQQDNAKPHTTAVTTAWLHSRSPDLSPTEKHVVHHEKTKQRRTKTFIIELESYVRQEWDSIPLLKDQQLLSSVPRCSQTAQLPLESMCW